MVPNNNGERSSEEPTRKVQATFAQPTVGARFAFLKHSPRRVQAARTGSELQESRARTLIDNNRVVIAQQSIINNCLLHWHSLLAPKSWRSARRRARWTLFPHSPLAHSAVYNNAYLIAALLPGNRRRRFGGVQDH